ncbi:MAG: hypothetical protein HY581_12305 [Nitrospirae bacterium]|nr:hypothetical protein [Nitrospirota bacterium]
MDSDQNPYEEGKRAGAHPVAVILGVIVGLWLLIWLYVPNPKHKQGTAPESIQTTVTDDPNEAPVMYQVKATIPELNVISVVVPLQATDSQIVGLLKRFREARLANTLTTLLPATTPKHKLGDHAVADIYIFSDAQYARPEAVGVLARGAHAPGHLYPQAIPFETAMEQVRGHYRIDLHDTGSPDVGSLGFADESGVHSKHYRRVF